VRVGAPAPQVRSTHGDPRSRLGVGEDDLRGKTAWYSEFETESLVFGHR
jgi:hypothetical protein